MRSLQISKRTFDIYFFDKDINYFFSKMQYGFIKTKFLIIIFICIVGFASMGYIVYKLGGSYQATMESSDTDVSSTVTIEENIAQYDNSSEIEALRKEVEELKQQSANKESQSLPKNTNDDLSALIKKWRPFVAYIECDFRYTDGTFLYTSTGSGLLFPGEYGTILTNRHVISIEDKYAPYVCRIRVPDDYQTISIYGSEQEGGGSVFSEIGNNLDAALITVNRPTQHMINLEQKQPYPLNCSPPSIGDKVVILGYPAVGSKQDITATEGIISGFNGDYFITSAKVEKGNSGGIAVSVKEDCVLGIPTYAEVGSVESLARILDFSVIARTIIEQ